MPRQMRSSRQTPMMVLADSIVTIAASPTTYALAQTTRRLVMFCRSLHRVAGAETMLPISAAVLAADAE